MTYLQENTEIARIYGFELSQDGEQQVFRKDASDGSYWLAFVPSGLSLDLAKPDSHIWNIGRLKDSSTGGEQGRIDITEALPLASILTEHEMVPVPTFDKNGDGEVAEIDYFSEAAFHGLNGKATWDRFDRVMRSIPYLKPVFDDGWELDMTGGGCTAFIKQDKETGTSWSMAAESGTYRHPDSLDWCVQRDDADGSNSIGISQTTLPEALAHYEEIPVPVDIEERYRYFPDWASFDEYMAEAGTAPKM